MDIIALLRDLVIPLVGLSFAWQGYLQKRLKDMQHEFKEQIEDKNRINQVVQANLKESIARLEGKIDMLIQLQITRGHNDRPDQS